MDYFILQKQVFYFVLSIIALYIFMAIDYTIIFNYVPIFYWGCSNSSFIAKIPGVGVLLMVQEDGLDLEDSQIQPSEFAKLGIILMLAKKLDDMDGKINDVKNFFILVFYAAVPVSIYC